jgi:hypothetical protein
MDRELDALVAMVLRIGKPVTKSSAPTSARNDARRSASATIAPKSAPASQAGASAIKALTTLRPCVVRSARKAFALPKALTTLSILPGEKVSSSPSTPVCTIASSTVVQN